MIRVMDTNSGQVILEVPSEHVLNAAAQIMQQMGLFLDHSA